MNALFSRCKRKTFKKLPTNEHLKGVRKLAYGASIMNFYYFNYYPVKKKKRIISFNSTVIVSFNVLNCKIFLTAKLVF